jgi:iron complex transport system ATP-binding protein
MALKVRNLSFGFNGKRVGKINEQNFRQKIFSNLDMTVEKGSISVIMGPNGAGKSTLLNCISGILDFSRGSISLFGQCVKKMSNRQRASFVAMVPQKHSACFPYKVRDFIALGRAPKLEWFRQPGPGDMQIVKRTASDLGIESFLDRKYTCLSGGEMRLVITSRALVQDTPLLLMDEPDLHLDFKNRIMVLEKVTALARKKNLTVLMTLHDPNLAGMFADMVFLLSSKGEIIYCGRPEVSINRATMKELFNVHVDVITRNSKPFVFPVCSLKQE